MKLTKAMIDKIENAGFTIHQYGDCIDFQKYSPEGQDFYIPVTMTGSLDDVIEQINDYYESFDPSREAYYWLDNTGHGKNGAPYDMGDIYADMVICEGYIKELAEIIESFM